MAQINRHLLLHECYYPQCHILVKGDTQYCPKHYQLVTSKWRERKAKSQNTQLSQLMQQQRQKAYDLTERDPIATAFYHSKQWQAVRDYVYSYNHATCQVCGNVVNDRKIVDHIVPRRLLTRQQALDTDNLWTLCYKCHYRKTKIEQAIESQPHGDTKLKHLDRSWWYKVLKEKKPAPLVR